MEQERKQEIALMRYSAIAPLVTGLDDDHPSLQAFFRDASQKASGPLTDPCVITPPKHWKNGIVLTSGAALKRCSLPAGPTLANPGSWMKTCKRRSCT